MTEGTATETQATETATGEQEATKLKPTETVEFWKQKSRENEARAKSNAEAATKLQQFEDRDKTEAQRLTDRAEAAEKRAVEIEGRALRLEVAAEKGLTPAQAKRLVGTTRDELEADAAELLDTFKPAADSQSEAVATSLDLGTRGGAASVTTPAAEFAKFIQSMPE